VATLIGALIANGGVSRRHLRQLPAIIGGTLGRLPFSLVEWLYSALARPRAATMAPPVFILGHWRSGTTHLYNVLSAGSGFGHLPVLPTALPWDFLVMVRLFEPLLARAIPRDRLIDRVPVTADSAQEDEIALANMQGLSFYHGLYFPRRLREHFMKGVFLDGASAGEIRRWERRHVYFLEKLSLQQKGKQLLLKNPVYTARVAQLARLWPGARFIHIHRNPYRVFESTRHFYRTLLPMLALQPYDESEIDTLVLEAYPRMMQRLIDDTEALPEGHFAEIRFEDFESDPLGELARTYRALGLDGFEEAASGMESYLQSVQSYQKNTFTYDAGLLERVSTAWAPFIERWGYDIPA
jgi:hypothetical protein